MGTIADKIESAGYIGNGKLAELVTLCNHAGLGTMIISPSGMGKTTIIRQAPFIKGAKFQEWNTLNYTMLGRRLGQIEDRTISIDVPEWSTLGEYHRDIFLSVCSAIMTEGNFYHELGKDNIIDIKDCKLVCNIAIQPEKFYQMQRIETFQSLTKDRFLKITLFNPSRGKAIDFEEKKCSIKLKGIENIEIKEDIDFKELEFSFMSQFSRGRFKLYLEKILKVFAVYEDKLSVNQDLVDKFINDYGIYIDLYTKFIRQDDLERGERILIAHMKVFQLVTSFYPETREGWVDSETLEKILKTRKATLVPYLKDLKEMELLKMGKKGRSTYWRMEPSLNGGVK